MRVYEASRKFADRMGAPVTPKNEGALYSRSRLECPQQYILYVARFALSKPGLWEPIRLQVRAEEHIPYWKECSEVPIVVFFSDGMVGAVKLRRNDEPGKLGQSHANT
jgi:hypothetical protein